MKSKTMNARHKPPTHYLLNENDLLKIDNLICALSMAVAEICECREIHERETEEHLAVENFDAQVEMVHEEARLRLDHPGSYSGDF
jgi:hypothetical protein